MKLNAAKKARGDAHPLQHLDEALRSDRAVPVGGTPAERRRDNQQTFVDNLRRLSATRASGKAPALPSPSPYTSGYSTSGGEPLQVGEAGPSQESPYSSSATPSTSATPCTSASPFSSTTPYNSSTPDDQAGMPSTSPGRVTFAVGGGGRGGGGGGGGGSGEGGARHGSIATDFAAPPPVSTTPAAAGGEAGAATRQSRLPGIARLVAFAVRKRQVQGEDPAAVQSEASGILGRLGALHPQGGRSPQPSRAQVRPDSGFYSRGRERDASAASAAGVAGLLADPLGRARRSLAMGAGASWDSAIFRASDETTTPPPPTAALSGGPKSGGEDRSSLVAVKALLPPPPPPASSSTSAAAAKGIGLVRTQLAARGIHTSTHGNVVDDAAIAEELQAQGGHIGRTVNRLKSRAERNDEAQAAPRLSSVAISLGAFSTPARRGALSAGGAASLPVPALQSTPEHEGEGEGGTSAARSSMVTLKVREGAGAQPPQDRTSLVSVMVRETPPEPPASAEDRSPMVRVRAGATPPVSLAMGAGASWDSAIFRASDEETTTTPPPTAALPPGSAEDRSSLVRVRAGETPPAPPSALARAKTACATRFRLAGVVAAAEAVQVVELTKVVELMRMSSGLGIKWIDDGLGQCRVMAIGPDSQAERSGGFAVRDRLVSLNGQPLSSYAAFKEKLGAIEIGGKVALEIAVEIAPAALAAIEAAKPAGGAVGGPKESLVAVRPLLSPPPPPPFASAAATTTEPRAERAPSTPERAIGGDNQRVGGQWGPHTPTGVPPPEPDGGGGIGGARAPRPAAISLGPSQLETEGPASPRARQHQWLSDEITQIDRDEIEAGSPPEGWTTCEDGGFVRVEGGARPPPKARTMSFSVRRQCAKGEDQAARHVPSMPRRQSTIEARLQAPAAKHVPSATEARSSPMRTIEARLQNEGIRMFGRFGGSSSRPSSPAPPPSRTPPKVSPPKMSLEAHGPPPMLPLDVASVEPLSRDSSTYSERAYAKLDGAILDPTPAAMRYSPDQEPPQVTHAAAPPCPSVLITTYSQRTPHLLTSDC